MSLLEEHTNVIISISIAEDEENLLVNIILMKFLFNIFKFQDHSKPYQFNGSVILMIKRLDDELTKIFQSTDCHSTEYIEKYVN